MRNLLQKISQKYCALARERSKAISPNCFNDVGILQRISMPKLILYIYENPVEKLLSADTFQKALKIQESFFVQQQMNFIDFIYNKEQDNALNKIYELLHKNNQKLSIRDTYRQLHIDKASLLQLVEQDPSLRLDNKYICCDNCDSN